MSARDQAAALTREQAVRAVEHELDFMGLSLAVFAPHGFDSGRVGDYDFATEMRATLHRLTEAWEVVRDAT